jgi:hypothetical protein
MRKVYLVTRVLASAVIVTSMMSCTSNPKPATTEVPGWASLTNDLRFRWSASAGIDILGYPAVAIRAYVESFELAEATVDESATYPGFLRATRENAEQQGNYLTQLVNVRPLPLKIQRPPRQVSGYYPYHILELTPNGDIWTGTVCAGTYAAYSPSEIQPGKFVSGAAFPGTAEPPATPYPGIEVIRIELSDRNPVSNEAPPSLSVPQKGPALRPLQDVFGRWFVSARSAGYWGPINDPGARDFPSPDLKQRCADVMPEGPAQRLAMATGFKDEPPPPGNATPGWPESSS